MYTLRMSEWLSPTTTSNWSPTRLLWLQRKQQALHIHIHSKTNLFKMNRFLFRGALTRFLFILQGSSSKIVDWIKGQRSNKRLIHVRNIEVGFLCWFVIFLTSKLSLLFDLRSLIQFKFMKRNLVKLKRNLACECPSEEESINFEEACFRV